MSDLKDLFLPLLVTDVLTPCQSAAVTVVSGKVSTAVDAQGALVAPSHFWTSDDPEERSEAAKHCHRCPVLTACREAGASERFGVWGGRDRSPRSRPRKDS